MKTFLAALALTIASPALAQAPTHHSNHGAGHEQPTPGKEKDCCESKDCCREKDPDGTPRDCCERAAKGEKVACCEKHKDGAGHTGHGTAA